MTKEQYRGCQQLSSVVLDLIFDKTIPESFNNGLKQLVPDLASDILSASINSDCPCRAKIAAHIFVYPNLWADYIYDYGEKNNLKQKFDTAIGSAVLKQEPLPSLSGKIASTTIEEWEEFVREIRDENYEFYSFSVVKEGDKLLVFFM